MARPGPHLLLETGQGSYAVPAEHVREIVWLPALSEAPSDHAARVGIADLRGRSLPVFDLDLVQGRTPDPYTVHHRLVELQAGDQRLGLVVADVPDVAQIGPEHLDEDAEEVHGAVCALARLEAGVVGVLDPALLTEAPHPTPGVSLPTLMRDLDAQGQATLEDRRRELRSAPEAETFGHEHRSAAVFALGEELFALPLAKVQEFVAAGDLAPVPSAPSHVLGLMNHRGEIVPVVDLRSLLGVGEAVASVNGLVAIIETEAGATAIAVDRVEETVQIDEEAEASSAQSEHAIGTVLYEGRTLPLLDPELLLTDDAIVVDHEVR